MRVSTGALAFFSAARMPVSCPGEKTLMCTCSPSASNLARSAQIAGMVSKASGKLMPSGRGHVSQVASWRAHSAGMRKPRARGVRVVSVEDAVMKKTVKELLVDQPLGQVAVGINAAVAQEGPVSARDIDRGEIDFLHDDL